MNVIDKVPEPHRSILTDELGRRDPALLAALQNEELPTYQEWLAVEDHMIDAYSEHYLPGHEPDPTGVTIDNALGAFFVEFPNDIIPGSPRYQQ